MIHEGTFVDDKRSGYGKEYSFDKNDYKECTFEGFWKDDKKNGKGRLRIKKDEDKDEIELIEGIWHNDRLV